MSARPGRRAVRVGLATVLLVAALLLAWWAMPQAPARVASASATAPQPKLDAAGADAAVEGPSAAHALAASAASSAASAAPAASAPGRVAVCGHPPMEIGRSGSPAEARITALILREKGRWVGELLADEHPRSHIAAALMMLQTSSQLAWSPPRALVAHCGRDDAACHDAAALPWLEQQAAPIRRLLDPLVARALTTDDVAHYALVVRACQLEPLRGVVRVPPSCGQVSAQEWARRDPGNADAWLAVAAQAQRRGDAVRQQQALQHVVQATAKDGYFGVVLERLAAVRPDGLHPAAERSVGIEALGNQFGLQDYVGVQLLAGACRADQLLLPGRRTLCEGLAMTIGERLPRDGMDLMVGAGLGARLGWSADRVARLREENGVLQHAAGQRLGERPDALLGCGARDTMRDYQQAWARGGELAAQRAGLDRLDEDDLAAWPAALADRARAVRAARPPR